MSSGAVAGASGPVATVDAAVKAAGAKSVASPPILAVKGVAATAAEGRVDGSTTLTTNGLLGVDDAGNVTKVRASTNLRADISFTVPPPWHVACACMWSARVGS